MLFEDVKIAPGDILSRLVSRYGYSPSDWKTVWQHRRNAALRASRGKPELIRPNDTLQIPIPWVMTSKSVTKLNGVARVKCEVKRNGSKGAQIRWVQTVDQGNQPIGGTHRRCVDACPPDDTDPFYWTTAELAADPKLRAEFSDVPSRNPPAPAAGTTEWRAVLSLAVVTGRRVSVAHSILWGFDLTAAGVITAVGPRAATAPEIATHINLLQRGIGTGGRFSAAGWTFRRAIP